MLCNIYSFFNSSVACLGCAPLFELCGINRSLGKEVIWKQQDDHIDYKIKREMLISTNAD